MGIWSDILNNPGKKKGTGAYTDPDKGQPLFGRPSDKTKVPTGKFETRVDKEKEYEFDGKKYYRLIEKSSRTKGKEEATSAYMPVEEFNKQRTAETDGAPDWSKKKVFTVYDEQKEIEAKKARELESWKAKKNQPTGSADRSDSPLAGLQY